MADTRTDGERQIASFHNTRRAMNILTTYSLSSADCPDQPTLLAGDGRIRSKSFVDECVDVSTLRKLGTGLNYTNTRSKSTSPNRLLNRILPGNSRLRVGNRLTTNSSAGLPNPAQRALFLASFPNETELEIHVWTIF